MKTNINYLKTTLIVSTLFFIGCETGVTHKSSNTMAQETTQSGIVDKPTHQTITTSKGTKVSFKKIFSNSAQPGFYLQVGFFEEYKPNATFINQLKSSGFKYTVLQKNGNFHALIGAYKSYNEAKSNTSTVKSRLDKQAFVVEVLRP
jgi:septal ring-binding cell division protein DamX